MTKLDPNDSPVLGDRQRSSVAHWRSAALVSALSILFTLAAHAEGVEVVVEPVAGIDSVAGLLIVASDGELEVERPVPEGKGVSRVVLELAETKRWRVECRSTLFWCPRQEPASGVSLRLIVFRRARLVGRVAAPPRDTPPRSLTVEGWLVTTEGQHRPIGLTEQATVDDEGRFSLDGPLTELDLRVSADGFVPAYLWGLKAAAIVELGSVRLQRGASLSGFVIDHDHRLPIAEAAVIARPLLGSSSPVPARLRALGARTVTNDRGFFQLAALAAGTYTLELSAPHLSPVVISPIELVADQETILDDLELRRPLHLEVEVIPPPLPGETPWRVSLESRDSGSVLGAELDETGRALFAAIEPGWYELSVFDASGTRLMLDQRLLEQGGVMTLEIEVVTVDGRILLDGDGLEATLYLSAGERDKLEVRSSDDGRFGGTLRAPTSPFVMVDVVALAGKLRRSLRVRPRLVDGVLAIRIELEDLRIGGLVVNENDQPVAEAMVEIESDAYPESIFVTSDQTGRFQARGLSSGDVRLTASHDDHGSSPPLRATALADESGGDHRLVLHGGRIVEGLLLDAHGFPVPSATLESLSYGSPPLIAAAATAADGRFQLRVAAGASRASLRVRAPSQLLWAGCVELPVERETAAPLIVTLPGGPGGTLRLEDVKSSSVGASKRWFVLTPDGGVLSLQSMAQWLFEISGKLDFPGMRQERPFLEVPGVAPGFYAAFEDHSAWPGIGAQICGAGWVPRIAWVSLASGAMARFDFDLPSYDEAGGTRELPPIE